MIALSFDSCQYHSCDENRSLADAACLVSYQAQQTASIRSATAAIAGYYMP
jgi:hypothetical protein